MRIAAICIAIGPIFIACVAGAEPYRGAQEALAAADGAAAAAPMPDVSRVTAHDLAGAFCLPLHVTVTEEMVRAAGEPRPYRYGTHQGTDLYDVSKDTPVYPAADGIVLRADGDGDYHPMTDDYRRRILAHCREVRGTPGALGVPPDPEYGDILDHLRGRQIWIYHGRNADGEPVITAYAHLNRVESIRLGDFVTTDTVIAGVGNSGTSQEGVSDTEEMHLHLELYIGEEFWCPRSPDEMGKTLSAERDGELRSATLRAFGVTER